MDVRPQPGSQARGSRYNPAFVVRWFPMSFPPLDPKPGQRAHAPLLAGSSDAWFLAEAARNGKTLAVFTSNAWDAQRLMEEIR